MRVARDGVGLHPVQAGRAGEDAGVADEQAESAVELAQVVDYAGARVLAQIP